MKVSSKIMLVLTCYFLLFIFPSCIAFADDGNHKGEKKMVQENFR